MLTFYSVENLPFFSNCSLAESIEIPVSPATSKTPEYLELYRSALKYEVFYRTAVSLFPAIIRVRPQHYPRWVQWLKAYRENLLGPGFPPESNYVSPYNTGCVARSRTYL